MAPDLMANVTEKRAPEVSRIIGESYAQLTCMKKPFHTSKNIWLPRSAPPAEDKYSLAYAYYKTKIMPKQPPYSAR